MAHRFLNPLIKLNTMEEVFTFLNVNQEPIEKVDHVPKLGSFYTKSEYKTRALAIIVDPELYE